ncbi:hypothetical protein [Rhizobium leguminosarum]|uniref:hypothetical protein n=1 Tax=Rhizobium leguminosarum TaxID=384 RepID=UPI002E1412A1|nr:hypothetical protein U8Q02_40640 [Rhizobium leguminosarum]
MPVLIETGVIISRLFVIAAVIGALLVLILMVRKPFARRSIARAAPAGTTPEVIEKEVRKSQFRFGLALWLIFFGLPLFVIMALLIANKVSVFH